MSNKHIEAKIPAAAQKQPSKEELMKQAQMLDVEEEKKFVEEYNELCKKYGRQIQPKLQLEVVRINQ